MSKNIIGRVSGFVLYDTPEDQAIAVYLEAVKRRGGSFTSLFKEFLYRKATGQDSLGARLDDLADQLSEIRRVLARGVVAGGAVPEVDTAEDLVNTLRGMTT